MKTILTEINIEGTFSCGGARVKRVSNKTIKTFDHDKSVVAVIGSRAMSVICAQMDLPGLKLYQLTSAGYDGVPLEEYAQKGVAVANAGSVYSVPIAETVVFGMLCMAKRLRRNPENRRPKYLRHYRLISELCDKRALILGAGNIGTEVARRLAGFDMHIDGYDPYCAAKAEYGRILRNRQELLKEVNGYDYIVSTLPDTDQTRGMINKEFLQTLKAAAVFVNVGRKATIEQSDLYEALKSGRIAGAVLDMFEKIPNPITNPFRRLKNVIVLPGVAAISGEARQRLKMLTGANAVCAAEGEPILHVVNGVR